MFSVSVYIGIFRGADIFLNIVKNAKKFSLTVEGKGTTANPGDNK